ncbi:transposase family protein [Streptomyces sp. NPDC093223]|uniref:helix-turn-helix domain-containing protein n=1 Tax=Streptomyces sp. NPDC093223 TaxID=3366033 RepID=UPI0038292FAC
MLVPLRHGATHDVLARWFGVDRSTITRAISKVRPLLAERGCSVSPGVRLQTLAQVVDHLGTTGKTGIIDGTEIRVRRSGARTGTNSFPARTSTTRSKAWWSRTGKATCCSAVRPSPAAARTSRMPAT